MKEVKLVALAQTSLPQVAASHGATVDVLADKYGRQVMLPYTFRDGIATAQASVTNGTPTVLHAGDAIAKMDLVFISMTNDSDAAVSVVLSDDGTTVRTFTVPVTTTNSGTITYDWPVPWPQGTVGGAWRVDMPDITGTTVTVDALFVKN